MSITRQVSVVNMIPAYNNGVGYFAFDGSATSKYLFKAWNVNAEWVPEFYGSETDVALSGRLRSNFRGYRLKASLQLDNSTEGNKILDLFNTLSRGYPRTVYPLVTNGTGAASLSLVLSASAPNVNDYFNNLFISGLTGGDVVVTDYVGSTRTATLQSARTWATALAVSAVLKQNFATHILFDIEGTSATYTDADLIPCVVSSNNFSLARQSTIHQQRISIEVSSVELFKEIPDSYRVA